MKGTAASLRLGRAAIFLAVWSLIFASNLRAERTTAPRSSQAAIVRVLEAQADAWNRGEIDGYMNGYARSDGTVFVSGDSITRGWKTVRDRYAKKYDNREKMGRLAFSDVEVRLISSDAALVVGKWKLTRKGDKPHGRFTLLFRRGADGWRIVHDHTSSAGS